MILRGDECYCDTACVLILPLDIVSEHYKQSELNAMQSACSAFPQTGIPTNA